jgi:hypothetical protein
MKKLARENLALRSAIAELCQQIAGIDAENAVIERSLVFFQSQFRQLEPPEQADGS